MSYQDTLHAIAENPHVWAQDDRAAIFDACQETLLETGQVHVAGVRKHLTRNVDPHRFGANISAFVKLHKMIATDYAPNGGGNGNANKPSPIWTKKEATA